MAIRADILETGDPYLRSAAITVTAKPSEIFNLLADPTKHQLIDGSTTVQGVLSAPVRLHLGAQFGMKMRIGIPYRITNTVIEFQEDRLIAWRHLGKWVWRYELADLGNGQTRVVESFDGRPSPFQWWLRRRNAYKFAEIAMAKTLVRIKNLVENE